MERLSDSDLTLFRNAQMTLGQAQSVFDFTRNHLMATYKLGPEDQVNMATGEITRPRADEAGPVADNG